MDSDGPCPPPLQPSISSCCCNLDSCVDELVGAAILPPLPPARYRDGAQRAVSLGCEGASNGNNDAAATVFLISTMRTTSSQTVRILYCPSISAVRLRHSALPPSSFRADLRPPSTLGRGPCVFDVMFLSSQCDCVNLHCNWHLGLSPWSVMSRSVCA